MSVCGICQQRHCDDHPDPCLGFISGAFFACCGHGEEPNLAYLVVSPWTRRDETEVYREWVDALEAHGLMVPMRRVVTRSQYWQRICFYPDAKEESS